MKKERKKLINISREKAVRIVQKDTRKRIHCFMGFVGADWDKKDVIDSIRKSQKVSWVWNVFNHNLAIIKGGNQCNFDFQHSKLK